MDANFIVFAKEIEKINQAWLGGILAQDVCPNQQILLCLHTYC
jgi:hypothetical protein